MHRAVELGLSRRSNDDRYYYLSIDEKAVLKGHEYISILSDEMSGIVLEVMEGRTDDSVDELCHTALTKEQRNVVKTVCTDTKAQACGNLILRVPKHTFLMPCTVTITFI